MKIAGRVNKTTITDNGGAPRALLVHVGLRRPMANTMGGMGSTTGMVGTEPNIGLNVRNPVIDNSGDGTSGHRESHKRDAGMSMRNVALGLSAGVMSG